VIYNEKRGGYINNIPATFARADTDLFVQYAFGGQVPANSVVINNFNIAGKDINPVTYTGLRIGALYRFNEDWSALLAQSYQNIEADGVFAEMAANSLGEPQPDLSVQLYNPSYNKDRFENTALTINGRVGALKLVYAGAGSGASADFGTLCVLSLPDSQCAHFRKRCVLSGFATSNRAPLWVKTRNNDVLSPDAPEPTLPPLSPTDKRTVAFCPCIGVTKR
jgi:hypothetical protein